ncbi:UNVERIFIED_CONTAM: hypothetical protein RMT77_005619 [Armadillidium vulgare]
MTLSNIIITFLICSLVSSFEEANSETLKSTKRPHVIIILADDLGWNDVGFHGNVEISTPNIDALAYSGVILNNYYVQPLCTPSRGALLSGMYPIHTGLQHHVIRGPEPRGLPLKFTLLPEYLKSMGYTTRIVGKWHLGMFRKEYTPTFRGFDSHYGYWTGRLDYYNHRLVYNHTLGGYDFRKNMDVEYAGVGKYATDLFTEEGVKIINEHNPSVPLFLYLPHLATHVGNDDDPLQAPVEAVERFSHIKDEKRRIFAAMLWKLDESIGKVVEALKDNDMLKDSIIIFSTDNGGSAGGLENSAGSNWPLKGTKISMWEGGIRGSAFVWSSLIKNPGRVSKQMMHITDWLPTLYSAIGGDVSSLPPMDGMNVWESLQGESSSPRKEILVNIDPFINGASIRVGEWKLLFNPSDIGEEYNDCFGPSGRNSSEEIENRSLNIQNSPSGRAVKEFNPNVFDRIAELKYEAEVSCGEIPENATATCNDISNPCLFNISSDPCEFYDVSGLYPSVVETLMSKLKSYNSTAVLPSNKPLDPRANPVFWNDSWTNWFDYIDQNSLTNEILLSWMQIYN